jgi:hypothetical protein
MTTWLVGLAFCALLIGVLAWEYRRKQGRSVEEFERDARQGVGFTGATARAGLLEIDKLVNPGAQVVAETIEEEASRPERDAQGEGK